MNKVTPYLKTDSGPSLKNQLRLHSYFRKSLRHRSESTSTFQLLYTFAGHLWFEPEMIMEQWCTDVEIFQSWSNPKLFHRIHIQSISENIKLWTPISNPNPKPFNQLHISQHNWYCLFCLMSQNCGYFASCQTKVV